MSGYRVLEGTQVNVDGVVYSGGELLPAEVRPGQVDWWLAAGWVVAQDQRPRATAKRGSARGTTATGGTATGTASE